MPGLGQYLEHDNESLTSTPETISLHLPSSLSLQDRTTACVAGVAEIEDRLRFGQASDALTKLRCQLTKRTYANQYKVHNVSSQRHYTRFRTLQNHTESKLKAARLQYTTSRDALLSLRGPGRWEETLRVLRAEDVRGLNEKALANEELEENRRTRIMAGLNEEPEIGELGNIENLPQTTYTLAVGEGRRTLSWIWYSTSGQELGDQVFVEDCEFSFNHSE